MGAQDATLAELLLMIPIEELKLALKKLNGFLKKHF